MPKVAVVDMNGKKIEDIELNDAVFGIEPNVPVMHQAVKVYLANQRQGTQSTLTRAVVAGGGRKPWKQKGTGHARQGSTRSPQWTHGGIAFGPKPRDFRLDINRKVKKLAIKSALSSKLRDSQMIVLDSVKLDGFSTKTVAGTLSAIGAGKKALIVMADNDKNLYYSARNIAGVKVAGVNTINVYDILNADTLVLIKDSAKKLEEVYA